MKNISLICALVLFSSAVLCQEVIVDSLTTNYDSGTAFSKTFQRPEWNNVLDFAIYGWFKLNSQYTISQWSTGFHFTSNDNDHWTNYSNAGDRVLAFQVFQDQLHNPTYSLSNGVNNYYQNLSYKVGDLDKWAFIYVGHSSAQSTQFAYFNLASTGEISKKLPTVTHATSSFYQIKVGQSFAYAYFPGSFFRLSIVAGPTAYKESGYNTLGYIKPDVVPSCPVLFTGCGFTGTAQSICTSLFTFEVTSIQSVYIPPNQNYVVTIYDQTNYAGKTVTYNQSIECITQLNWALLVSTNVIKIEDEKTPVLRKNTNKNKKN